MVNPLIYNSFDPEILEPVSLSGWKHHLGFISQSISVLRGNISDEVVKYICSGIGGSVVDLYTGNLSCNQIANEVKHSVETNVGVNEANFKKWLNTAAGYKLISISDGSSWTVKLGRFNHRYIHVHPSRYSKDSIRVKSTTLRTAIAYCFVFQGSSQNPSFNDLNFIRKSLLDLPPLKEDVLYHPIFQLVKFIQR